MKVFKKFNTPNYSDLIMSFNPKNPSDEHKQIIEDYKTPSREYIKKTIGMKSMNKTAKNTPIPCDLF